MNLFRANDGPDSPVVGVRLSNGDSVWNWRRIGCLRQSWCRLEETAVFISDKELEARFVACATIDQEAILALGLCRGVIC